MSSFLLKMFSNLVQKKGKTNMKQKINILAFFFNNKLINNLKLENISVIFTL